MDLVRPLGLAGVRCVAVARPGARTRYSRFTVAAIDWADPRRDPDVLLERLIAFGSRQVEPPILFYEGDWDLLLVSRRRDELAPLFRFVVADAELVEDVVDKERFRALAARLELPVPASRRLEPDGRGPGDVDLRFPLILKPITRYPGTWGPVAGDAKAIRVDSEAELRERWAPLSRAGLAVLAQEEVPGPESRVESYHVYVDAAGKIAGEFTGRKLRTLPSRYGQSTALEITRSAEIAALGRELVTRLSLRGVAKLDFKRDPEGRPLLLEVNSRFNLWHHPGALAGVNLPALVYDDLVGRPRRPAAPARAGVRWCHLPPDAWAAREAGVPVLRWAAWVVGCEAKSAIAVDDPMPIVRTGLWRLSHRLRRSSAVP